MICWAKTSILIGGVHRYTNVLSQDGVGIITAVFKHENGLPASRMELVRGTPFELLFSVISFWRVVAPKSSA